MFIKELSLTRLMFPSHAINVYRVEKPVNYDGLNMKKDGYLFMFIKDVNKYGTIIYDRILYVDKFPKTSVYKGSRPWLWVSEYDWDFHCWNSFNEKTNYTQTMFYFWRTYTRQESAEKPVNYDAMMRQTEGRKHKKLFPRPELKDELERMDMD